MKYLLFYYKYKIPSSFKINFFQKKVYLKAFDSIFLNFGFDSKIKVLGVNKFLFAPVSLNGFFSSIKRHFRGFTHKWCLHFKLIGVQYTIKRSRRYIDFIIGYNYNIRLKIPRKFGKKNLTLMHKKRNFSIYSNDFNLVFELGYFLRKVQCLEPYKVKGLIYQHESRDTIKLKPGKRQK
jgi:ribosomal protein L6P/L9E